MALDTEPRTLDWDMAWTPSGVQQVWGLGVPLWRLPFEVLAKISGQHTFPDRLAFGVALTLIAYSLLRLLVSPSTDIGPLAFVKQRSGVVCVLLLILSPPFLALCRTLFDVYEEAQAYAYLAGIGLFGGTMWFFKQPLFNRYLILAVACGLAPLVRPTVGAYSVVSLLLAWYYTRRLRWPYWKSWVGVVLFAGGAGLLFFSNLDRFGSGFEFGHSVNVNGYPLMIFETHIANPVKSESLPSLIKELFCYLFLTGNVPLTTDGYATGLFPGQLSVIRWRDVYFSAYDLTFLVTVVGGWLWSFWALCRRCSNQLGPNDFLQTHVMGAWSCASTLLLFAFYLYYPVLTTRYMIDFAPAFAVATWVFVSGMRDVISVKFKSGPIALILLGVWWGYEVFTAKVLPEVSGPTTISRRELVVRGKSAEAPRKSLPDSYAIGLKLDQYDLPFNGAGWNTVTGETKAVVTVFVENPQRLELSVEPAKGAQVSQRDWTKIRAKIGVEFLKLESCEDIPEGKKLVFKRPEALKYQFGFQMAFLGFANPEELVAGNSKFRLLRVRWHD